MTLLLVCNLNCYFVFVSEVLEEDQQLLLQPTPSVSSPNKFDSLSSVLYHNSATALAGY